MFIYGFKQLCHNIPFCKIDIIRTKIKNVTSYHIYTSIHIFINELYTKFYSNNNSWRNKKTLLKTADIPTIKMQDISDQRSSESTLLGFFLPLPTGRLTANRPPTYIFLSTTLCLADTVVGYQCPNSIRLLAPYFKGTFSILMFLHYLWHKHLP